MFCAVKWFLWELTYANKCDTASYQVPGHVLLHHVIQSFHGTSSAVSCQDKCRDNLSCHSINWYRKTALCQLNSGTHLSYPEGLVPVSTGSYMLYSPHPMVTCSNKFCSHGDICLMGKDGISYRCESKLCRNIERFSYEWETKVLKLYSNRNSYKTFEIPAVV